MIETAAAITAFLLLAATLLAFFRLVRGPSLPDRVIALDLVATLLVALILTICISFNDAVYLPAAIGVALLGFLGTVVLAQYIVKGGPP